MSRTVIYWVTTVLPAFELGLGGVWDVLRVPQVRGVVDRLGYPAYFLVILGIWKLLGAVAVAQQSQPAPELSGVTDPGTLAYLVVMMGITATSWLLRPASRRNFPPN